MTKENSLMQDVADTIMEGVKEGDSKCIGVYSKALDEEIKNADIKNLDDIRYARQLKGLAFFKTIRDMAIDTIAAEKPMFEFYMSREDSPETLCDYAVKELDEDAVEEVIKSLDTHANTFTTLARTLEKALKEKRKLE